MAKIKSEYSGIVYDNEANARHSARNLPLDGLPQEAQDYCVIRMKRAVIGDVYWLHDPDLRSWTNNFEGAYRYTPTDLGRDALKYDLEKAKKSIDNRGLNGSIISSCRIRKWEREEKRDQVEK